MKFFSSSREDGPHLHALIIGVGDYPHLIGGSGSVAPDPFGLSQLTSPPPTALAIADWLMTSFHNPDCPLGSVELLVSSPSPMELENKGTGPLERATMSNIERAFKDWYERCSQDENNIALFYFCGHGLARSDQLLLAEEFADPAHPSPWWACIDFTATRLGMRRCRAQTQLFFVDASRSVPIELLASINASGVPLISATIEAAVPRSATYCATSQGAEAFGRHHSLTYFAEGLLAALNGSAATSSDGMRLVDSYSLGRGLADEMNRIAKEQNLPLQCEFEVTGNARIHVLTDARGATRPRTARRDGVTTHPDDPATIDALDRRPFAQVVATRIQQARDSVGERDSAFMVHIHGSWGSGKTSILNFLGQALKEKTAKNDGWIVVNFNAWRHQRLRPPWWTLIAEIYHQSLRQLGLPRSLLLRLQWFLWRARADWLPVLIGVIFIAVAVLLATGTLGLARLPPEVQRPVQTTVPTKTGTDELAATKEQGGPSAPKPRSPTAQGDEPPKAAAPETSQAPSGTQPSPPAAPAREPTSDLADTIKTALELVGALIATGAAIVALSRSLLIGSPRAAQAYIDLRSDPLRVIIGLLRRLVDSVSRPVAVFIDDLDRCNSAYVAELLEGVQTLFQTVRITYVIAADRKWICSSFEKVYRDFGKTIGQPGRPLGYLFLDKVFQVSVPVPRLSDHVRQTYWASLLKAAGSSDPQRIEDTRKNAEKEATVAVQDLRTPEAMQEKIAQAQGDPVRQQAIRAAAAKQMASPEVQEETEHRLQRFAPLLESNPRSMKRFVNAYGLSQSTHLLEGRQVSADALAQWTIVELRWPQLAEYLAIYPQTVVDLTDGKPPSGRDVPADLRPLFRDSDVKAVVSVEEGVVLTERALREII